ncbi:hypothetical protein ABIF34_007035 [Bradyrhizobium japonicum]
MRYEFDVLRKLPLQGREFDTGVILASQSQNPRHIKVNAADSREAFWHRLFTRYQMYRPRTYPHLGACRAKRIHPRFAFLLDCTYIRLSAEI